VADAPVETVLTRFTDENVPAALVQASMHWQKHTSNHVVEQRKMVIQDVAVTLEIRWKKWEYRKSSVSVAQCPSAVNLVFLRGLLTLPVKNGPPIDF
jgi:hypothetical protein